MIVIDEYLAVRAAVLMSGLTGLRRSEVLGLTRRHLNLLHRTVMVSQQAQRLEDGSIIIGPPKTDAGRRVISLPPVLVHELERHLATFVAAGEGAFVFAAADGGPLSPHVVQQRWAHARRRTGLDHLHFHDLRHTANTLTAALGASTCKLMYRMGHASQVATLRYQHATAKRDRELDDLLSAAFDRGRTPEDLGHAEVTPADAPPPVSRRRGRGQEFREQPQRYVSSGDRRHF